VLIRVDIPDVSERQVRAHVWVCAAALVENPSFDSQSKEALTTHPDKFGSAFEIKPAAVRKLVSHTGDRSNDK